MKEYIEQLLRDCEKWRIEAFISKMRDVYKECSTNEQGKFIQDSIYYAEELLRSINNTKLKTS